MIVIQLALLLSLLGVAAILFIGILIDLFENLFL